MSVDAHTFVTPRTVPWFSVVRGEPRRVWLVLHGLGQRARPLAEALAPAVPDGVALVVPEALARFLPRPMANTAGACWSTGDDAEADLADNVAYLDALRAQLDERWSPEAWDLVGFSQGGLTAARWLGRSTHRWDRVVLWASALPRDVDPMAFKRGLGEASLRFAVGDADPYLTAENRQRVREAVAAASLPFTVHPFRGAHEVPPAALAEVLA